MRIGSGRGFLRRTPLLQVLAFLGGFLSGLAIAFAAEDIERVEAGARIADGFCARCHGVGDARSSPVERAPPFRAIADDPAMTEQAIRQLLRTSHETMPNYILSTEELEALTAYIRSLSRP